MVSERPLSPTLLFDGECRVCSAFARLISWWNFRRRLRVLPFQQEEARRLLLDFTDEEVQRSAHLVLEDGEILSGPHAFPALLDRLPALGSLHQQVGRRFVVRWLVHALYDTGVALRGASRCATPHSASTA
ncbi:MAG: thiol-disulfide oxidoreductase DCC family protein [Thermoplasmata archaeon]